MINISYSHAEGVHYYMLFNMAAIVIGIVGAGLSAKQNHFSFRAFAAIVSSGILLMIIVSKLVLFDSSQWLSLLKDGFLSADHGKSVVGAIAGGMIGAWGAGKILGIKGSVLDLAAVSFPLALAVQRLGCLFAGCCHGNITSVPWGITYGPGSKPFLEQQHLGLIPADAATSLAIHPDQIYNIIACICIAIIAWKTNSRWKSHSGKFIFSVLLYLGFRFMEEFTRFSIQPVEFGLKIIQWKILVIFCGLALFLFIRERKYAQTLLRVRDVGGSSPGSIRLLLITCVVLLITFLIGGWLTGDERTIIIMTVMPLCGIVILDTLLRTLFSESYARSSFLILAAFMFMSQKADTTVAKPESYTSFNLVTGTGKLNQEHEFNYEATPATDCDGQSFLSETTDKVVYRNNYRIGGIGISRKIYYNQWRSLLASLNIYAGKEKQTPINNPNVSFTAPHFNNTLWSISPMLQYDDRAIGFGVGGSFGMLGHDVEDDASDHKDYNPKTDARTASLQARIRIFSERFSFIEVLGGYDLGSVGEYNWQLLYGTRFNGNKYLMKAGFGFADHGGRYYILQGQMRLSPRFYISPQLMLGNKSNSNGYYDKSGYRAALGLEYRINDK